MKACLIFLPMFFCLSSIAMNSHNHQDAQASAHFQTIEEKVRKALHELEHCDSDMDCQSLVNEIKVGQWPRTCESFIEPSVIECVQSNDCIQQGLRIYPPGIPRYNCSP